MIDAYATHLRATSAAFVNCATRWPNLPIYELGCGEYSTPVLSSICHALGVRCNTVCTDGRWLSKVKTSIVGMHTATTIKSWDGYKLPERASCVLIDNEQLVVHRCKLARRIVTQANAMVMHDADTILKRGVKFDSFIPDSWHVYTDSRLKPHTLIASQIVDPRDWLT